MCRIKSFCKIMFLLKVIIISSYAISSLPIEPHLQKKTQLCWASCCYMILDYYHQTTSIDEIVAYATGKTITNLPNAMCGQASYFNNSRAVLWHFRAIESDCVAGSILFNDIKTDVENLKPIFAGWHWNAGGGHVILIRGFDVVNNFVIYNDPGKGWQQMSYATFCNSGIHT